MASCPAEFLVESLLADALLLGQWGAQKPSHELLRRNSEPQQAPQPASRSLTQMELRRQRNRECMRRARQNQRESLERMRTTVQSLMEQLGTMLKSQASDQPPQSKTEPTAKYAELAETAHRLKAENSMLEHTIVQHENARTRLMSIMDLDNRSICQSNGADAFTEYELISHEQAQAATSHCCKSIAQYKQYARPLAHWIADANAPSCTFGWSVTSALRPGRFFILVMTKKLVGVSAEEAMQRSWAVMAKPRETDKSPSQRLSQSVLLQKLDSHTCVMGNDWHHPVKPNVCMRSITVRTCRATPKGYAVNLGTLNPQDPERRRRPPPGVEYLDASTWHDFADEDNGSGCVATLHTLWQYDTNENLRMRLVNALSTAWRWENEVMLHPMKLLML